MTKLRTRAGLFVYTESPDPAVTAGRQVTGVLAPSPDPPGMFTVAKATGSTLTLTLSGSQTRYYFNVVTRKFTIEYTPVHLFQGNYPGIR